MTLEQIVMILVTVLLFILTLIAYAIERRSDMWEAYLRTRLDDGGEQTDAVVDELIAAMGGQAGSESGSYARIASK